MLKFKILSSNLKLLINAVRNEIIKEINYVCDLLSSVKKCFVFY